MNPSPCSLTSSPRSDPWRRRRLQRLTRRRYDAGSGRANRPTWTAARTGPPFAIIETHIVLRKEVDTGRYPLHGDVARLADGRYVARFMYPGIDGTTLLGFRPWERDEDVTKTNAIATDWAGRIRDKMQRVPGGWSPLLPTDKEYEFAHSRPAFRRWRSPRRLSRSSGPLPPGRPRSLIQAPFNTKTWYGGLAGSVLIFGAGTSLCTLAASSCAHGPYITAAWSDDELWTRDELPVGVQNSIAIATRTGGIQSRFILDETDQLRFPAPISWTEQKSTAPAFYGRRPTRVVDVLSAPWLRSGPTTLVWIQETQDAISADSG